MSNELSNSGWRILTGSWRVATSAIEGKKVKMIECIGSGVLYISIERFMTDTEAAFGTWEYWYNKADASVDRVIFGSVIGNQVAAGQDGYHLNFNASEEAGLVRIDNGSGVTLFGSAAEAISVGSWNKIKITRSLLGVFSVYINDSLIAATTGTNPITDLTHTTINFINLDLDAGSKIAIADVKGEYALIKKSGVV